MRRIPIAFSIRILLLGLIAPLFAQNSTAADVDKAIQDNVGNSQEFKTVMTTLQKDVTAHDAAGVAALIHYPFGATIAHKTRVLRTPAAFVQSYDAIVTPPIAKVIEQQKYEDLFVSYRGAMFGRGEVWIQGYCRDKACKGVVDIQIATIQSTADLGAK